MKKSKNVADKFVPGKFENLVRITEKIERMQYKLDDLAEEVALDIIDGWTTGDKVLDFALVVCDGVYDPFLVCMQYRRLYDLGLSRPGQKFILIQTAERFINESEYIVLRNIYLASFRKDFVEFDVDKLTMRLPVEPNYFLWREVSKDGYLVSGYRIMKNDWLTTGPIHNQYCNYGAAAEDDEALFVPDEAVCDIGLFPLENRDSLFIEHEITAESINYYMRKWVQLKTKSIS